MELNIGARDLVSSDIEIGLPCDDPSVLLVRNSRNAALVVSLARTKLFNARRPSISAAEFLLLC